METGTVGAVVVGKLIIARNLDPKNEQGWELLKPNDVPAWLNKPNVIGAMVDGHIAHDPTKGLYWYCAIQVPDAAKPIVTAANDEAAEGEADPLVKSAPAPRIVLPEGVSTDEGLQIPEQTR